MKPPILSLFFLLFLVASVQAQQIDENFDPADPDQMHFLVTKNMDQLYGKVISLVNTELKFVLYQDTVTYQLSDIAAIEVIDVNTGKTSKKARMDAIKKVKVKVVKGGEPRLPAYRNFMSETAFRMDKNVSEYRNSMLFYNSYDYGLSDYFSVGVQSIVPALAGVRAKYTNDIGKMIHWGIGTAFYVGFFDSRVVNHSFGILTLGTPNYHLSFTGGYGWSLNDPVIFFFDPFEPIDIREKPQTAVYSMSGSFRIANSWRVMFEYATLPSESNFNRFFSTTFSWFKYRSSLDFGVVGVVDDDGFATAIPVVAFGYRFGNR